MKTIKKLSIIIIIFCTLSCSNDNSSNEDETNATVKDIYVCGIEIRSNGGKSIATFWKNGVVKSLTDGTKNASANDIAISGEDVYVVGYEVNTEGEQMPKIWKNGVSQNLPNESGGVANKIVIIDNDVYVIGYVIEGDQFPPKIWKNGNVSELQGIVENFAVNKGDIYTVVSEDYHAKVWKNGVVANLTNEMSYSEANDIAIKGNDVYIVGQEQNESVSVAKLWKNGVGTNLSDEKFNSATEAISIVGNDVYVSGSESNTVYISKIWRNGKEIWSKENISIKELKVIGEDFYVLSNSGNKAQILKNGLPENLSSAFYSYANALFITTN